MNKDEYIADLESRIEELEFEMEKLRTGQVDDAMKFYKVRDDKGGYSKGGGYATFTKPGTKQSGKTWSGTGPLRSHLNQYAKCTDVRGLYKLHEKTRNWEVVEIVSFPATTIRVWDLFGADSEGVFERKRK